MSHDDCIEHNKSSVNGYQRIMREGIVLYVHRLICAITHNLPYDGDWITRHTCDNRRCIRAEHVIPGTYHDNMLDRDDRKRHGMLKLSDEQIHAIRVDNRVYREIALDYGISIGYVSQVKSMTRRHNT